MRVQLDRFEDGGWAVLILLPEARRTFDAPRDLLPEGAKPGDVFRATFEKDEGRTEEINSENGRLMDELLGGDDG